MGLDRRRLARLAVSPSSVAVVTALAGSASAIVGAIGAVPSGLRLTDTSEVTDTTWVVVSTALVTLVVVSILAVVGTLRPRWWKRPLPEIVSAVVLVGALSIAVGPLRAAISTSFDTVRGPVGTTMLPFTVAAVALSAVAIAVAALAAVANSHRRTLPASWARLAVAVVAATVVVVVAVTVTISTPPTTRRVAVARSDASVSPALGDPTRAVAGAGSVVWRAPTAASATVGDRIIVADDRSLDARDIRTGARLWSIPRKAVYRHAGLDGPFGVTVITDGAEGTGVAVVRDGARLTGLDTRTGEILWWSDAAAGIIGADTGTTVLAVYARAPVDASNAERPVSLVGVDSRSGRERWSVPLGLDDRCSVDGAVAEGHAIYTDCDSRVHAVELATGRATAITGLPRARPSVFAAGSRIGLRTLESTVSRTRLLEPDASGATDPPLDERVLSPVVGDHVLIDSAGAVTLRELATGRDRTMPLEPLSIDSPTPGWSSVAGDTLVGGARRSGPGFDPVVASVDTRSGAISTIPSPCRWGVPATVDAVGDRVIVRCDEVTMSSRQSELVVIGPATP